MTNSSAAKQIDSAPHAAVEIRGRATLFTGIYTGALLILVMLAALVAANRVPALEPYALERNAAACTLFVVLMLVPVLRFLTRPLQMFASAMLSWALFVAAYNIAGMVFHNLFQVLRTPFEALIEGSMIYGVFAVASWVLRMCLHARRHPIQARRRTEHAPHHR